jgi:hypothetical protein
MAENLEALVAASNRGQLDPRFRGNPIWNGLRAGSEGFEVFPRDPPHLAKQLKLRIKVGLGGLEPVAQHTGAMDPERAADCVPKLAGLELALARKHFNPVQFALFNRDAETARDIQDIKAAKFRRQWLRQECPEVAAPARLFQ